jgi:hypothetical protein
MFHSFTGLLLRIYIYLFLFRIMQAIIGESDIGFTATLCKILKTKTDSNNKFKI